MADVRAWDSAPPNGNKTKFSWAANQAMKEEQYEVLLVWHQSNWSSAYCHGTKLTGWGQLLAKFVETSGRQGSCVLDVQHTPTSNGFSSACRDSC